MCWCVWQRGVTRYRLTLHQARGNEWPLLIVMTAGLRTMTVQSRTMTVRSRTMTVLENDDTWVENDDTWVENGGAPSYL